jgi:two-component system cell cycle sensor histidine kinase/response regulator CckA
MFNNRTKVDIEDIAIPFAITKPKVRYNKAFATAIGMQILTHQGAESASITHNYRGKDGKYYDIYTTANSIYAINCDERKNLQNNVDKAQRTSILGQMAGGIAHDFNNKLAALSGFCEALLEKNPVGTPSFTDLYHMKQAIDSSTSLIKQLTFARDYRPNIKVFNLVDFFTDLEPLIKRVLSGQISYQIENQHTNTDDIVVELDQHDLQRVIINMAINARDAILNKASNSKEKGKIIIKLTKDANRSIAIYICDNGTGIDQHIANKIFDPFFTTKSQDKGTGMGLATSRSIIEAMHGSLTLDASSDNGAIFKITLPLANKDYQANGIKKADHDKKPTIKYRVIILVEDEESLRFLIMRQLKAKGHTVHDFPHGQAALNFLRDGDIKPDTIITDVKMPKMTGPELISHLDKADDYKIIVMSGYADKEMLDSIKDQTSIDFINKPFSLKDLLKLIA